MEHDETKPDYGPSHSDVQVVLAKLDRPIVLVGMMGVGKTSVGRKLAALLGCQFVDADEEIETAAAMTIPEIFERHGEAYFRDGERRVIARLIEDRHSLKIISTGGGAFCNEQTRRLILDRSVAVWLDSDVDTLVERTSRKDNRPLLKQGNPREILAKLRTERRDDYAQAHVHVLSTNGPQARTIGKVVKGISEWL